MNGSFVAGFFAAIAAWLTQMMILFNFAEQGDIAAKGLPAFLILGGIVWVSLKIGSAVYEHHRRTE